MNPKGKRSITLTVPVEAELTGKELKKIILQILESAEYYYDKVDEELLKKLEAAIL